MVNMPIDQQAIDLGAVSKVTLIVESPWDSYHTTGHAQSRAPFSDHYFNADGLEVAYCILLMRGTSDRPDLHVLDAPRHWDPVLLEEECYTVAALVPEAVGV
jgi:hypothetical protein